MKSYGVEYITFRSAGNWMSIYAQAQSCQDYLPGWLIVDQHTVQLIYRGMELCPQMTKEESRASLKSFKIAISSQLLKVKQKLC